MEEKNLSAERVQWLNIQNVVRELAKFCFGDGAQCGQITLGAAYTTLVNSLTAKDGPNLELLPLPAPAASQPAQGVGLTDEQIIEIVRANCPTGANPGVFVIQYSYITKVVRAILARQTAPTLDSASQNIMDLPGLLDRPDLAAPSPAPVAQEGEQKCKCGNTVNVCAVTACDNYADTGITQQTSAQVDKEGGEA